MGNRPPPRQPRPEEAPFASGGRGDSFWLAPLPARAAGPAPLSIPSLAGVPDDDGALEYISGIVALSILQHPANRGVVFVWGERHQRSENCVCESQPNCPSVVEFIARSTGENVVVSESVAVDKDMRAVGNVLADLGAACCVGAKKRTLYGMNASLRSCRNITCGRTPSGRTRFFHVDPRQCAQQIPGLPGSFAGRVEQIREFMALTDRAGAQEAAQPPVVRSFLEEVAAWGVSMIMQCPHVRDAGLRMDAAEVKEYLTFLYTNSSRRVHRNVRALLFAPLPAMDHRAVLDTAFMHLLDCTLFMGVQRWADPGHTTHVVCGAAHTVGVVALARHCGYRVLWDSAYQDQPSGGPSCLNVRTLAFEPAPPPADPAKRRRFDLEPRPLVRFA